MSVAAPSLITLDQLKLYLGPNVGTTNDALLELLIDNVSEEFNRRLGRTLAKTTYTSLALDGDHEEILELPNWPAVSVTSIYEDDVLLVADTDYEVDLARGLIKRVGGHWSKGFQNIVITYVAGYTVQGATPGTGETALPADLKLACMIQTAREWKKTLGSEWGETSRSFPDGSSSRVERGLLKDVEEILQRYTRYGL